MHPTSVILNFGREGRMTCQISGSRLLAVHQPPAPLADVRSAALAALESPLDFPALREAVVPGDRIVVVLDRQTPAAGDLVAALWEVFASRGVEPADVQILQPADIRDTAPADPRTRLPDAIRDAVDWRVYDPTDEHGSRYLATSAAGDRIYLSGDLVDADFVIPVGPIAYDTLLGYRGTGSGLFPGLSTIDALRKAHGQGHDELGPDDLRPLRQVMDEVSWLLGVQFALQVIPAAQGGVSAVLAGQPDAVLARGKQRLAKEWEIEAPQRPELVVAAVESDAGGHTWTQIAAALEAARRIVVRDGRIVILSELDQLPTAGISSIRESQTPRDALKPLREAAPPDLMASTQLARTLDWANVYLHSRLEDDLVEELFMVPLRSLDEVRRALAGEETCVILGGAQHTYARVTPEHGSA